MELSKTIASMAVVLGVVVAGGFAAGEDKAGSDRTVAEKKGIEEQEKRRAHFERACNKPLKTENDKALCRAAYRALGT
jgi:hypothetical protein